MEANQKADPARVQLVSYQVTIVGKTESRKVISYSRTRPAKLLEHIKTSWKSIHKAMIKNWNISVPRTKS